MSVLSDPWEGLSPPYGTIVADPPWHYDERVIEYGHGRAPRSEAMPYSTMSVEEIAKLPVVDLAAAGAHLYLWTTNAHIWQAREVAVGWGFEPVQLLTWCKPPQGLKPGGMFSPTTEFVIYARRTIKAKRKVERAGRLIREAREAAGINRAEFHRLIRGGTPTGLVARWEDDDSLPNDLDWHRITSLLPALRGVERPEVPAPEPSAAARVDSTWWEWPCGAHSVKPPAFYDLIERVSPEPRVDLFCRQPRFGWDSWGWGYEGSAA